MSNFIGMVFATLKKEGIDTSKMDTSEAIAKYNEIQGGAGGSSAKGEETPKTDKKTATKATDKENLAVGEGTTEKDSADATVSKKETVEGKGSVPKEHQAKVNYLKDKINNSWYANAKMDYGVNGSVKDISVSGNTMKITVEEDGKTMTSTINYIDDYSPEQLYNIWQEFPDNDSSNEMQSAEKITSSMGISPDEAKAFVSGKGSLSKGGYEGVSNVKSAPTFEYNAQKYTGDKARFNNLFTGFEKGWGERAVNEELSNIGFNEGSIANFNSIRKTLKLNNEQAIEVLASMFNISHNRK